MTIHNIFCCGEIRKISIFFWVEKKKKVSYRVLHVCLKVQSFWKFFLYNYESTHLCQEDSSTLNLWNNPFPTEGVSG